jgi:hypothetical protein
MRDFVNKKIIRIKKLIIIKRETKKRGGKEARERSRSERLHSIYCIKESVKKDLLYSWKVGELRKPDKSDWDSINVPSHQIPISFLSGLKKKYWGENIYNEL